jgi:hypothetical protein
MLAMTRDEYVIWLKTTPRAERERLLRDDNLPGQMGSASERDHVPGMYPVLLALMMRLAPGMPPDMKAGTSLLNLGGKWVPFILVPPTGYSDATFKHECRHITQFFDNAALRAYMIAAQTPPPENVQALADFGAQQFAGRALAEVEVYRDVDAHSTEASVFAALNDAVGWLNRIIGHGLEIDRKFVSLAKSNFLAGAKMVAQSPYYSGFDVEALVSQTLKRISSGQRPATQWKDLKGQALTEWIERNADKPLSSST